MFRALHVPTVISALLMANISLTAPNDASYEQLTQKGIAAAYNLQIDEATQIFNQLITLDPGNPHGHVLQAVNYFYRIQFEEQPQDFEKQFKKHSSDAIGLARRFLSSREHRINAMFYLGTMQIYLAAYHADQGNWLRAYWFGKDGLEHLERVAAADSSYYDAYLGLGLYHYYADVMPRFLKTVTSILGIEGDRKRGLQELQLAAEKGVYSKAEALFFLVNINIEMEKDNEQALNYSRRLVKLYPKGFLLLHGEVLQRNGYHEQAIDCFKKVIAEFEDSRFPFFVMWACYDLANAYFELNEFEKSTTYCEQVLDLLPKSSRNLEWMFARCNFRIAENYEMLEKPAQATTFYKRVEKSGHRSSYELGQQRLKKPLSKLRIEMIKGQNLARSLQFEKAVAAYEQILRDTSFNDDDAAVTELIPEIHHYLGKIYHAKQDYDKAISEFDTTLACDDIQGRALTAWTHFYLGKCYLETGVLSAARAQFEIAHEFDDRHLRFEIDKLMEQFEQ